MSKLNEGQAKALAAIEDWLLNDNGSMFLLSGNAGTGKTFCIDKLIDIFPNKEFIFTAPTNKATKVISNYIKDRATCRTIYSLLGLTLDADGEVKKLKVPEKPLNLADIFAIIVDEASMINRELFWHIKRCIVQHNTKFIFMGDPAQLPPIKEVESEVWAIENRAHLTEVMRFDNAILKNAMIIRDKIENPDKKIQLITDANSESPNEHSEGVWKVKKTSFVDNVLDWAEKGLFSRGDVKVIAWRNVTVDYFNKLIRKKIYGDAPRFVAGERVMVGEHIKDSITGAVTTTDTEGIIQYAAVVRDDRFDYWRLEIETDDYEFIAKVVHEDSVDRFKDLLKIFAAEAKSGNRRWKDFWDLKETFHDIRYAYAITAHKSQGSTYDTTFVCSSDILENKNFAEALRCLYVASTRAKRNLIYA